MEAGAASASRQQRGSPTEGFQWWWEGDSGSLWIVVPAGRIGGHPCLTSLANRDKLIKEPHF